MSRDHSHRPWLRTDAFALALVLVSLAVGVALTWQRWGDPLVDCGREMNQPLRLLRGERLYGDVTHIYGPLAPVVNAALYRVFGVSLDTLRSAGVFATLVILGTVYWLARRLMGRTGAALSAISVTWACALSITGYILPYTYAAVYGVALSLLALALAESGLRSRGMASFFASGILTALAFLAKTEMGLAALAGGLTCVLLASAPHWRAAVLRAAVFLVVALGLPIATCAWIASRVGWAPLLDEGHLLYQNVSPSIVFFYKWAFGLGNPWESAQAMLAVALRLALVASLLAWLAMRLSAAGDALTSRFRCATGLLVVAVAASSSAADWDGEPYLAVPLVLIAMIVFHGRRLWKRLRAHGQARGRAALGLALAVFALTSLARSVLRARSDSPYGPYLLPAAIVLFTYLWCALLPALLPKTRGRRFFRAVGVALLTCWTVGVAIAAVLFYRTKHTTALVTPRGVMMTTPKMQRAFKETMTFIEARTRPDDFVAVFPEGAALLFFTDRRNPQHEDFSTPGLLDEDRAIRTLAEKPVALVLVVVSRATSEFGPARFGRGYAERLMRSIEQRFVFCGRFGAAPPAVRKTQAFYIDAYCAPGTEPGASSSAAAP